MIAGILEALIILSAAGLYWYLRSSGVEHLVRKLVLLFLGVLLFELMSAPMWINMGWHSWTYIAPNLSWVVTLGWTVIFMVSLLLTKRYFSDSSQTKRFFASLGFLTVITTPIEVFLLWAGLRDYATVLTSTMSGVTIPFTAAPIEILVTVPMIGALVIPFYWYLDALIEEDSA